MTHSVQLRLFRFVPVALVLFAFILQLPTAQEDDPVEARLETLGVVVPDGPSPRPIEIDTAAPGGRATVELPETYAPLGNEYTINRTSELGFLNLAPQSNDTLMFSLLDDQAEASQSLIATDPASKHPATLNGYRRRYVTYGDLDQDGLDEVILVYRMFDNATQKASLNLQVLSNIDPNASSDAGPETYQSYLFTGVYIDDSTLPDTSKLEEEIALTTGDLNADGKDEVIVVICCKATYNNQAQMITRKPELISYSIAGLGTQTPTYQIFNRKDLPNTNLDLTRTVYPEIAVESVDADVADEIAVVLNERTIDLDGFVAGDGSATYVVWDDTSTNYTQVAGGAISAVIDNVNRTALVGNVAIGDLDGDGFNEIALGGLTDFSDFCLAKYMLMAKDDALHSFGNAGTTYKEVNPGCQEQQVKVRYVHMSTFDVNSDGRAEVQLNDMVYKLGAGPKPAPWTLLYSVGMDGTFIDNSNQEFFPNNSTITTGNFVANTVQSSNASQPPAEELIFYSPVQGKVSIWGINPTTSVFGELVSFPYSRPSTADNDFYPVLFTPDVDQDATVLRFVDHKLYYTEPIIIAVVAAAPCNPDWAQDPGNCSTSFGDSTSTSEQIDKLVGMEASVTVGYSFEDITGFFGGDVSATLSGYLNESFGELYTRSDTRLYTTIGLQDMVVFTSIPVDRYRYELISCDPKTPPPGESGDPNAYCLLEDPTVIEFSVDLPRKPETRNVSRDFYNNAVPPDKAVLIDSSFLKHTPGDPSSYLTESEKDELLAGLSADAKVESIFNPPITGQGSNTVTDSIEIGTETSYTTSAGFSYEYGFSLTAGGFMAGFTVGFTQEDSLTIATGSSALYESVVAGHDTDNPEDYQKWQFKYGMFAYQHTAIVPGITGDNNIQRFQVINFWTESNAVSGWPPTPTPTQSLETPTVTGTPPTPTPTLQPTPDGSVELLVNTSFETYDDTTKQPTDWAVSGAGTKNKVKCNTENKIYAHTGFCAYRFKGTGIKTKLRQIVAEAVLSSNNVTAGVTGRAAVYASGKGITPGSALVKVKVIYTDSSAGENENGQDKLKFDINLSQENVYQLLEQTLIFDSVPSSVKFQVLFSSTGGKLQLDDVSMSVESSANSSLIGLPRGGSDLRGH